jgi:hypothetical protein
MTDDLEQRIAELTAQEICFANRELSNDIANAALDFWKRGDTGMPFAVALQIFHDEIKEAYATRKTKPPFVPSQASLIQ